MPRNYRDSQKHYNQNRNADGTFAYCTELDQRQKDMIVELITNGGHKTKACETLGIPRSTLYKWFDNEKFMAAYKQACERIYQDGLSDALRTMIKLMKSPDSRTALKASEDIMKLNGYLDTKLDVQQNPQEVTITLIDVDEENS